MSEANKVENKILLFAGDTLPFDKNFFHIKYFHLKKKKKEKKKN